MSPHPFYPCPHGIFQSLFYSCFFEMLPGASGILVILTFALIALCTHRQLPTFIYNVCPENMFIYHLLNWNTQRRSNLLAYHWRSQPSFPKELINGKIPNYDYSVSPPQIIPAIFRIAFKRQVCQCWWQGQLLHLPATGIMAITVNNRARHCSKHFIL